MDRFCSQCGAILEVREVGGRGRPVSSACGHVVRSHFTLGVGGMLVQEGKVLQGLRNIEPDFGHWSMPGGYVEMDETLNQAVVRESEKKPACRCSRLACWRSCNLRSCAMGILFTGKTIGNFAQVVYDCCV